MVRPPEADTLAVLFPDSKLVVHLDVLDMLLLLIHLPLIRMVVLGDITEEAEEKVTTLENKLKQHNMHCKTTGVNHPEVDTLEGLFLDFSKVVH
jgi:hypothetical protein